MTHKIFQKHPIVEKFFQYVKGLTSELQASDQVLETKFYNSQIENLFTTCANFIISLQGDLNLTLTTEESILIIYYIM